MPGVNIGNNVVIGSGSVVIKDIPDDTIAYGNPCRVVRENYYSVGGGVHLGEQAEDAVIREVYEESGVRYEVDRLAVIHENFYYGNVLIE